MRAISVGEGRYGFAEHAPYNAIHIGAAFTSLPRVVRLWYIPQRAHFSCRIICIWIKVLTNPSFFEKNLQAVFFQNLKKALGFHWKSLTVFLRKTVCHFACPNPDSNSFYYFLPSLSSSWLLEEEYWFRSGQMVVTNNWSNLTKTLMAPWVKRTWWGSGLDH